MFISQTNIKSNSTGKTQFFFVEYYSINQWHICNFFRRKIELHTSVKFHENIFENKILKKSANVKNDDNEKSKQKNNNDKNTFLQFLQSFSLMNLISEMDPIQLNHSLIKFPKLFETNSKHRRPKHIQQIKMLIIQ